ncbi:MAG: segregation/condensation protein A [Bacillota bacterium]|nr:segregation/condensation protein A [Bacillota bacterium]
MAVNIKISNFEGPFDLLLHLIKVNQLGIYDISILEITNQYIQYINSMKEMDLEITSEFIVMAATLLEIKSRELLPKNKENETDEEDPKAKLIQKLIEYKKFKEVSLYLRKKEEEFGPFFVKKPEIIDDSFQKDLDKELFSGKTLMDLYIMYKELIERNKEKINTNGINDKISADTYRVEDKMEDLRRRLSSNRIIEFSKLSLCCNNKMELVVTFLALLELVKQKEVKAVQKDNFNEIYIERII